MNPLGVLTITLLLLLLATPSVAMAADAITDHPRRSIRTTDRRVRTLLDEGLRTSPTLRALVERLQASDVVVYLQCEGPVNSITEGRLTFVSAAGGYRYVVVRMVCMLTRDRQIALMAHELRHAVEIADTPDIVDGESLIREYKRMGYVNTRSALPGITFDTRAAVDTGVRVLSELLDDESD
jgi:hypothetical protein